MVVFPALPIGGDSLDHRFGGYTHAEVLEAMESYDGAGRRTYAWSSLTLDTLYPVIYVGLLSGLIYRFRPSQRLGMLACLPFLAGALDLGENIQVFIMLIQYPDISTGQADSASLFTSLKFTVIGICFLLAFVLALNSFRHRARASRHDRRTA